jgi:hypothetical protein
MRFLAVLGRELFSFWHALGTAFVRFTAVLGSGLARF